MEVGKEVVIGIDLAVLEKTRLGGVLEERMGFHVLRTSR